jgi:hypothetical protein
VAGDLGRFGGADQVLVLALVDGRQHTAPEGGGGGRLVWSQAVGSRKGKGMRLQARSRSRRTQMPASMPMGKT